MLCYLFHFPGVDNKHHIVDSDTRLGNVGRQNLSLTI